MNIQCLKLTIFTFFIFIGGASFAMQQNASPYNLEFITEITHFHQFKKSELRLVASTCKNLREKTLAKKPKCFTGRNIFNTYLHNKYLHPDCIFAHCVYQREYDKVKWLLKNKNVYPICVLNGGILSVLSCYDIAKSCNDDQMIAILDQHKAIKYHSTENLFTQSHCRLIIKGGCLGNRNITREYSDEGLSFNTMGLLICAGIKNKDIDFLKELRKLHKHFKKYMSIYNDSFLVFVCAGNGFQKNNPTTRTTIYTPTKEDLAFLTELIKSRCFKSTDSLINYFLELNMQNENLHAFDAIIKTLVKTRKTCSIQ